MSFENTHHTPESKCPYCGHKLDAVSNMSGDTGPSPGDASMCIACGEFLEFDQDMLPITMSETLRNELDPKQLRQMLFFQDHIRGKHATLQ